MKICDGLPGATDGRQLARVLGKQSMVQREHVVIGRTVGERDGLGKNLLKHRAAGGKATQANGVSHERIYLSMTTIADSL